MDDLDFSNLAPARAEAAARSNVQSAAHSSLYNPAIALEFFKSTGSLEKVSGGKPIFVANEKKSGGLFSRGDRMYLLLDGEVGLMINNRVFAAVKPGEIFGELAVIAGVPRSATAMPKTDCSLLSLDQKQFHAALGKSPEFALMLMSIMVGRLRQSIATLGAAAGAAGPTERGAVFERVTVAELATEFVNQPPIPFPAGKVIFAAGSAGASMYVVIDGRVAVSVNNRVIERIPPGGIFGELALVDRSARAATATAETDCRLLSINRNEFLALIRAKPLFGASLLRSIAGRMQSLAVLVAKIQA